jgi:UDP-glucose-4-epimerase GalE
MQSENIRNIIFSSTCATYGVPDNVVIDEDCPQKPINPYGQSKLMIETILKDLAEKGLINQISLRYFNAAGDDKEGEIGERHNPETHLIPLAIKSALSGFELKIFGTDFNTPDGTAVRDYIHVEDLARAHILALEHLVSLASQIETSFSSNLRSPLSNFFNLGTGVGHSVKEVIDALKALGLKVQSTNSNRRDGDPAYLVAEATKAKNILGWQPQYTDINSILATAVNWHRRNE